MPYATASPLVNITDEDIDAAINIALASSGGGLSVKSPKLALTHAPEGGVYEPRDIRANEKYFKAVDPEGASKAEMLVRLNPDKTAFVQDMLVPGQPREMGRGALGVSAMRDLLAQFRAQHPEIEQITGRRVSGSAMSGGYDPLREGRQATVSVQPRKPQFELPKSK